MKNYNVVIADAIDNAAKVLRIRDDLTDGATNVYVKDAVCTTAGYNALLESVKELKEAVQACKYSSDLEEIVYSWLGICSDKEEF